MTNERDALFGNGLRNQTFADFYAATHSAVAVKETRMYRAILLFAALMLVACSPTSITISIGATPTFTPTLIPTVTPTQTPDTVATAQVEASVIAQTRSAEAAQSRGTATAAAATAQANATGQAQAQATATAQARASATAVAATAQANATAAAQAVTAATKTALLAFVDALVAKAGRPVREPAGTFGAASRFNVSGNWKNFVLDVQLSNPTDQGSHSWDYGFEFREPSRGKYLALVLRSDKTWALFVPEQSLADRITLTRLGSGTISQMDVSSTGSNKVRFVVYENAAFLYVNGEFVSAMDISVNPSSGELYMIVDFLIADSYGNPSIRFNNLSVAGLP
jgi:hypothetical protein